MEPGHPRPQPRVPPGRAWSDRSQRTAARHNCTNTSKASWRNHVDVDVNGQGDTADRPYRQADVACQVS
ncbi:hypothetical protein [Streptomyces stramineus]|uniref:hypothetical protein n=1 Tax=Streptomyces stramineus TaxID=173861 RepID=UPI003CD09EAD